MMAMRNKKQYVMIRSLLLESHLISQIIISDFLINVPENWNDLIQRRNGPYPTGLFSSLKYRPEPTGREWLPLVSNVIAGNYQT
jgi:hypothetical protein